MKLNNFDLFFSYRGRTQRACLTLATGTLGELWKQHQLILHPKELQYLAEIPARARKHSFLLGRYAAKTAITGLHPAILPQQIKIESGVFFQPVINHPQITNTQVSITHSGCFSAAIAFPEDIPIGIDLEEYIQGRDWAKMMVTNEQESELIKYLPHSRNEALTMVWTIKESVAKALKTGLTIDQMVFEIGQFDHNAFITTSRFTLLLSYKTYSFFYGTHFVSLAVPSKAVTDLSHVIAAKLGTDDLIA